MIAGAGIARFIPTPRKPLPHAIITGNSEPKAYPPTPLHCLPQSCFLRIPIGFPLAPPAPHRLNTRNGSVAEWSKAHAWKVCRRGTVSRVRIPIDPPYFIIFLILFNFLGLCFRDSSSNVSPTSRFLAFANVEFARDKAKPRAMAGPLKP